MPGVSGKLVYFTAVVITVAAFLGAVWITYNPITGEPERYGRMLNALYDAGKLGLGFVLGGAVGYRASAEK